MSYKDQRELAALPQQIEGLEAEQAQLTARMSVGGYHRAGPEQLRADRARLQELAALLVRKYERWQALEEERARLA